MDATELNRGWYWASHLLTIRMDRLNCLLEELGGPYGLMELTDRELDSLKGLTEREKKALKLHRDNREMILESYEDLEKMGIRFVGREMDGYPVRLKEIPDSPAGLFVRGRLPDNSRPSVAIVGARACSAYGRDCASYFGRALSRAGIQVISGMAGGIDSTAQNAAVEHAGSSFAVLGGGVDLCYPKECCELYENLIQNGGVLSEMLPKTSPRGWMFVRRNRIISGISDAVIVIEARERSGSLITANDAAEQGRLVYAVPGRIDSALSFGCHALIRNGAILLQKPQDLLEDLRMTLEAGITEEFSCGTVPLEGREEDVYSVLSREPSHMETLLEQTGYPAGTLFQLLLQLEIKGYACQNPRNYYRRTTLVPPGGHVKSAITL